MTDRYSLSWVRRFRKWRNAMCSQNIASIKSSRHFGNDALQSLYRYVPMVLYRHHNSYYCGPPCHWRDQMTKIATRLLNMGHHPAAPVVVPKKRPPVSSTTAPTKTATDWLVVLVSLLLLVACINSTIITSRIMAVYSNTSSSSSHYFMERFPDSSSSSRPKMTNAVADATTKQWLRHPPLQPATTQQRQRQLYEFVTPNIRDCAASGLLETCPYVTTSSTNSNSNSTNPPLSLFTGACPSSLQQMITDNWCYNNGVQQEVCCGLTSDECCEIAKSYLALFFALAVMVVSPVVVLFACAYGRCCCWYPKLWNAKSNRGCGRRPSPPLSSNNNNDEVTKIDPHGDDDDDNDNNNAPVNMRTTPSEMIEESAVGTDDHRDGK